MMTEEFDILGHLHFQVPEREDTLGPGRRQAFRTVTSGIRVRVRGELDSFAVNDISAGGVCLAVAEDYYTKGQELTMDVLIVDKRYIAELSAVVVRVAPEECACAFQNLTRHQELRLDKLVLEMQKRYIAQRRQQQRAAAQAEGLHKGPEPENHNPQDKAPTIINLR